MAKSDGSRIRSDTSNHLMSSPFSVMRKTVGDTESTATIWPCSLMAKPATISMYLETKNTEINLACNPKKNKKKQLFALPYDDPFDKLACSWENLHSWAFVSAITHYDFSCLANDGNFTRIPKLAFFFARIAEVMFKQPVFVEYLHNWNVKQESINNMRQINLNAMIVGVRDDDIFINAQTEAMRGIELPFCRTQLSKTNAGLHGDVLWIGCQGSTAAAGSIRGTWRGWDGRRWPWLVINQQKRKKMSILKEDHKKRKDL